MVAKLGLSFECNFELIKAISFWSFYEAAVGC